MNKITTEQYEAAIPACCALQTVQEHVDERMLCWTLVSAVQRGQEVDCGDCELATRARAKNA